MTEQKPIFQLIIGDGGSMKIDNAIAPVRWCTNKELIHELVKHPKVDYLSDIFVVLTVLHPKMSNDGRWVYHELSRTVSPIADGMAYVTINRPGDFYIQANIVCKRYANVTTKNLVRLLTECNRSGKLCRSVLDESPFSEYPVEHAATTACSDYVCNILDSSFVSVPGSVIQGTVIDGSCDPSLFSSITPSWFTDWVNHGYEQRVIDQCSFRRRLMVWFLLKSWSYPIAILLYWVGFSVIGLVALFLGYKLIDWHRLFTFRMDEDAGTTSPFNQRLRSLRDNTYLKHPIALLVHPVSWPGWYYTQSSILDGSLMALMKNIISWISSQPFSTILYVAATVVATLVTITAIGYLLYDFYKAFSGDYYKSKIWRDLPEKFFNWVISRNQRRDAKIIENISCGGDPFKFATAPKPRSIKLLMKDIKSKVCKPMSM